MNLAVETCFLSYFPWRVVEGLACAVKFGPIFCFVLWRPGVGFEGLPFERLYPPMRLGRATLGGRGVVIGCSHTLLGLRVAWAGCRVSSLRLHPLCFGGSAGSKCFLFLVVDCGVLILVRSVMLLIN